MERFDDVSRELLFASRRDDAEDSKIIKVRDAEVVLDGIGKNQRLFVSVFGDITDRCL